MKVVGSHGIYICVCVTCLTFSSKTVKASMWGTSFLYFPLAILHCGWAVKTLPYSIFPLKTKHLNMCNLLERVAFISPPKKNGRIFLQIPAAWFAHRVQGHYQHPVVLASLHRRWFTFSVFFAVATVAREADLSKLAPKTILLFLWLGQKFIHMGFLWLKWKT